MPGPGVEIKFKMAAQKQPDRQVKKKHKLEMSENLDITEKKRKLVEPGVKKILKMAARKQPDRQVKKKRKLEMPEKLDITNILFVTSNHQTTILVFLNFFHEFFSF